MVKREDYPYCTECGVKSSGGTAQKFMTVKGETCLNNRVTATHVCFQGELEQHERHHCTSSHEVGQPAQILQGKDSTILPKLEVDLELVMAGILSRVVYCEWANNCCRV